ncbi:histidine phosphatase family protein [Lacticigenium naphthae]|uniref:histidine phosphatase family protein n=1 Tax=Lacticigenium naphthae TaxID=515351 RepID=UPI00040DDE3B|nr:histidine phosphatase family protein [Lacticigenium naphthae]
MVRKLYLMRHGETVFNLHNKIQGWCDSPLTKKGKEQARAARAYFKEKQIDLDAAYCSTSERASDTLELITELPYKRLKGLKEMNYGELEGESERLNRHLTPKDAETFYLQFGGESSNEVKDRMTRTLTSLMENEDHEHVLAVSHSGACFNFLREIQDPMKELKKGFGNGTLFVYDYIDETFTLNEVIRQPI